MPQPAARSRLRTGAEGAVIGELELARPRLGLRAGEIARLGLGDID
jgi:hypothetical protein